MKSTLFSNKGRTFLLTIIPLFEEQDSRWVEGDWSVHGHHSGGVWPEEALHLVFVSYRKAEPSSVLNNSFTAVCPAAKSAADQLLLQSFCCCSF